MKKYSVKKVFAGLALAAAFIFLANCLILAIRFFFRLVLVAMENPVELLATLSLLMFAIWVYDIIVKSETPETK